MQELMRRIGTLFTIVIALLSVGMAVKCIYPRVQTHRASAQQRAQLQEEVDALRQQIASTKRDIDRLKTSPYFVEQLARTNHRVADNEIVFIFEE